MAAARPADQRVGCHKQGALHLGSQSWQPLVGWIADLPVLLSFHAERSLPDLTPTGLPQTLFEISPSLASLVDLHEPQFIKFEPESFKYHRHLAGLGASGLEVNPCLVRLGTTGALPSASASMLGFVCEHACQASACTGPCM